MNRVFGRGILHEPYVCFGVASGIKNISLFVRVIESYSSGKYTYVPWKSIALIVAGILYFTYPMDLIPDFIPVAGIIDDVALIAWIYKSVQEDIEKFLEWEKRLKS